MQRPEFNRRRKASERLYRTESAHNTTQGGTAVWCSDVVSDEPLGERRQVKSIFEKVVFANSDAILDKERPIFLSKTNSFVMLFLSCDVSGYHPTVTHAICKTRIFFRPTIEKRKVRVGFHPFTGGHFEVLHKFRHGKCWRKRNKNMHMVWHTTNTIQVPTYVVNKAQDIGIEFPLMVRTNSVFTPMCAEHDVIECLCVTHTKITQIFDGYCTLSPVSDRQFAYCHLHHTAPMACVVLRAACAASRVSDTVASERLYRTGGAHNTTQGGAAVCCSDEKVCEPLEERRQYEQLSKQSPVSDRQPVYYYHHHTVPMACVVLRAACAASRVSDTTIRNKIHY